MKCALKHCPYPDGPEEVSKSGDSAQKNTGFYTESGDFYHYDCYRYLLSAQEAFKLWKTRVNRHEKKDKIVEALNELYFKHFFDPDFVVFGLKHAIKSKFSFRSPYGLQYYLRRPEVAAEWEKKLHDEQAGQMEKYIEETVRAKPDEVPAMQITRPAAKPRKGFGSVLHHKDGD